MHKNLNTNVSLKTVKEKDSAVADLNDVLVSAAIESTPNITNKAFTKHVPTFILDKIKQKRKLRKLWQTNRSPETKSTLNKMNKEIKELLDKENEKEIGKHLQSLEPNANTNYSL